ncbi:uncharacterized protein LOC143180426 [Calliopsis andreniformis]|uniref:uncharacterized protein LOC143180426 n=1 Tax=Calliopsis andreniformis TaxID=337506 RepID=UPI003FCDB9D9
MHKKNIFLEMSRPDDSPCSSTDNRGSPDLEEDAKYESHSDQEIIAKKKRLHLSEDAQKFCLHIYQNLRTMGNLGKTEALKRTSVLTGVSATKIYNLTHKGVTKRKQRLDAGKPRKLTPHLEGLIKNEIYNGYCKNEIPTIRALHQKLLLLEPGVTLSEKTLRIWLKQAGFKFQLINKKTAIQITTDC